MNRIPRLAISALSTVTALLAVAGTMSASAADMSVD